PGARLIVLEANALGLELDGHQAAPTRGRQLSTRCSTRPMTSMRASPATAMMITPTNTLSVWKLAPAMLIIKPIPAVAADSSPTPMPIMARPPPSRRPVSRNGMELGKMMVTKMRHSDEPKLRAPRSRRASMVRTPASALTAMGSTASRKMTTTFDARPMPAHMMMSGRKATWGVAFRAARNGSTAKENRRDQPADNPSGMPTAGATENASPDSTGLVRKAPQISPLTPETRHEATPMALGAARDM